MMYDIWELVSQTKGTKADIIKIKSKSRFDFVSSNVGSYIRDQEKITFELMRDKLKKIEEKFLLPK